MAKAAYGGIKEMALAAAISGMAYRYR